jgi:hypothetical protein
MPEINITQKDLTDAENFLTEFLTEKVPEASFARGGAMRDLAVKAFTYIYAYLRGEIDRVTVRQSLLRIQAELAEDDDIAQAVDEILSNWFATRKTGLEARMTARFHFSERRASSIPVSSKFWRTNTLIFYIDSTVDPYVVSEDQLLPVYDSRGILVDYVVEIPLRAANPGENYIIDPGTFVRIQIPGGLQYLSYVEHLEKSSGGKDIESSTEMIARSETAITVRNLINNRSCDAVLQDTFQEIDNTLTIGMGESEMVRDRRTELAPLIDLHIGGYYDTYVDLRLTQVEENLTVGGYFARPDNVVNMFRDPQLTRDGGITFTSLGIQPGHVIHIRSGIIGTPRGFTIIRVADHELEVSPYSPFNEASDELDTNAVEYSIGWLSPGFEEIDFGYPVPATFARTAQASTTVGYENVPCGTSRHIQSPGAVVLNGRPVQDIIGVEITDPDSGDPLIDPSTGTVILHLRVNDMPANAAAAAIPDSTATQYQLVVINPDYAQSMYAVNLLNIGAPDPLYVPPFAGYEGKNLKVVYTTLADFINIHGYITDRNQRVSAANHLLRALHPIWINFLVEYRLRPNTTDTFDTVLAAQQLAEFINVFDSNNDDLDASDISTFLRFNFAMLGTVYPFTDINPIYYQLYSPDGQVVEFTTTDIISIFAENGVTFTNSAEITPPAALQRRGILQIASASDLRDWFAYVGISDRTVKYRTTAAMITFQLKG